MGTPCYGHVNTTLGLVYQLSSLGETVIYYNDKKFKKVITQTGVEFRDYKINYENLEITKKIKNNTESNQRLKNLIGILDVSIEENEAMYQNVALQIQQERPDYIIHDTFCYIGKRLGRELGIPVISCIPIYIYSRELSYEYPEIYIRNLLRLGREELPFGNNSIKNLQYLYHSLEYHVYMKYGFQNFDFYQTVNCISDYNIVFSSPFLFRSKEVFNENFLFAGCGLEYRKSLEPKLNIDNTMYIVISLGTTYVNQQKEFYRKCFEAFGKKEITVHLNIGENICLSDFNDTPENFVFYKMLPQLSLLENAQLFITHGGANSTREALFYGVPMLIYALDGDQFDVAARMLEMGVAEVFAPHSSSAELYQQTVNIMFHPKYRERCQRIKKQLKNFGGNQFAANAIIQYIDNCIG